MRSVNSSKRVRYVLNGFRSLSEEEREEFIKLANEDLAELKKGGIIKEGMEKPAMVLGPLSAPCPCCGG
jgi:hypothetical protein